MSFQVLCSQTIQVCCLISHTLAVDSLVIMITSGMTTWGWRLQTTTGRWDGIWSCRSFSKTKIFQHVWKYGITAFNPLLLTHVWHNMSCDELCLKQIQFIFTLLFVSPSALNLIGPRAMDVLAELSYVSMTPDHFPSMFCKVKTQTIQTILKTPKTDPLIIIT